MPVQAQGHFIQSVAKVGQPFGVLHHRVEIVTMHQPKFAPIQHGVRSLFHHLNTAKVVIDKVPRKLVVVTRHIDHMAALAHTAQDFLHHVVVCLWPIPFAAQLPSVNDVANQVQVIAGVRFEKV